MAFDPYVVFIQAVAYLRELLELALMVLGCIALVKYIRTPHT